MSATIVRIMRKYKYKYFQFPLVMLQKVLENSWDGFNLIIDYSLVKFADKLPSEPPDDLQDWQAEWWDTKDKLDVAKKILSVKGGSNKSTYDEHRKASGFIAAKEATWGKYPTPGIKTDFIFDTRNKKNESETELIAALIGIKSLIGQHKFTATYKNVIVCRMCGCKRNDELEKTLAEKPYIKAVHDKYSTRRRFDGLIQKLLERGFIRSKIAYGRQIYISDELNKDELIEAIVTARLNKRFKNQEQQARQTIKQKLNE
jgi:hypothetical protein